MPSHGRANSGSERIISGGISPERSRRRSPYRSRSTRSSSSARWIMPRSMRAHSSPGTRNGIGSSVHERAGRSIVRRHVVGHAVLLEQALDLVASASHLRDAHRPIGGRHARPGVRRAHRARRQVVPVRGRRRRRTGRSGRRSRASVRRLTRAHGGGGRACASTRTAAWPRSDRVRRCRRPRGCVRA